MRAFLFVLTLFAISLPLAAKRNGALAPAATTDRLPKAKRIVFLGDSITHSGQYIEYVETILLAQTPKRYDILDLGLSSETVSGLSEPGHANGAFPRPCLRERQERVLAKTKPDLVIACYGMNDGIYYPFSEDRFDHFAAGIERLRRAVDQHNAHIIHLTPPVFDPLPIHEKVLPAGQKEYHQPFEGYNHVLDVYAEKLLYQSRNFGWRVIDLHGPLNVALAERRKTNPDFSFAPRDGIHPDSAGHWVMAQQILKAWGVKCEATLDDLIQPQGRLAALHKLVAQRLHLRSDAWLTACGHKRPGVKPGLPLEEAERKAAELTPQIENEIAHLRGLDLLRTPTEDPAGSLPPTVKQTALPEAKTSDSELPPANGEWHGFPQHHFMVDGKDVTVVSPKQEAEGRPWCWHGEFFGYKPDPDIALLNKGFHVVYMKITDMLGSPSAVAYWNHAYDVLTKQYHFNKKPALVGLSRGGLYCYNWAIANPTKVSCIYGDAPVCDFKSWPGGKGKGKGDKHNWELVLKLWEFKDEAEALAYKGNPVDNLAPLAKAKVPLLHVFGEADDVVPPDENTLLLAERYRKLGGTIELIGKPGVGHHPHGLEDSTPIINFILKNAGK